MNVLIVDDQRSARRVLAGILSTHGSLTLHEAATLAEARAVLEREPIDVALIDIRLSEDPRNRDGLTLVGEIREKTTAVPIVVTVFNEMREIREAMRLGAYDYILKDELCEELVAPVIEGLRNRRALEYEVQKLRARRAVSEVPHLVGASPAMERLRANIHKVALSDRPALVVGPTGSGKELVVSALHALGAHPEEPLLDLNCGAIPDQLIESQLFGHKRGAFTGADRDQDGYFAAVRQGTLFLDEIAELPLPLQAKLLRVLETGRFRPIGTTTDRQFAGRVVAATHADLLQRVAAGSFREDLYYRLNVLEIRVPSLDERREDIPALIAHFARNTTRPLRFTPDALEWLRQASWPGGVRQLRNLVDRVAVFAESELVTTEEIAAHHEGRERAVDADDSLRTIARSILKMPAPDKLAAIEQALIGEAIVLADGNKSAAARLLGVHRKVVERRIDRGDPPAGDDEAD